MTLTSSLRICKQQKFFGLPCFFLVALLMCTCKSWAGQVSNLPDSIHLWDRHIHSLFGHALRFDQDYQTRTLASLAKGRVRQPNAKRQTLYQFEDHVDVIGQELHLVYDLSAEQTSLNLSETLLPHLASMGYNTLYSCSGEKCGPSLGWQLLVSPLTLGTSQTQAYSLMGRYPLGEGFREYLQLYWNQTGCCPRLSVRVIKTLATDNRFYKSLEHPNAAYPITVAYFASGSSTISPFYQKFLSDLAKQVPLGLPQCQLRLIGYTDSQGDPAANRLLSRQRANQVRTFLIAAGLDKTRFLPTISTANSQTAGREDVPERWRRTDLSVDCEDTDSQDNLITRNQ